MKNTYIQPQSLAVKFSLESNMLAASFGVGMKQSDTWNGSDACSNGKEYSGNSMWKGMEGE